MNPRNVSVAKLSIALNAFLMMNGAQAMCYLVHDASDTLIYRSQKAPVSMSSPSLSDAVERRFPGGLLSISSELPCALLDLTNAEGRAQAIAQRQLRSAGVMSIYTPYPTASPTTGVEPDSAGPTPSTSAPITESRERIIERRVVETRTETVYVPVISTSPQPNLHTTGTHHHGHIDSTPTVPASISCGDRGLFSFCANGSRANNPGHFAYGTDGKLKQAQPQSTPSIRP